MTDLPPQLPVPLPSRWSRFWSGQKTSARAIVPDALDPHLASESQFPALSRPFWRRWRFWLRVSGLGFAAIIAWLAITAPLSKSLEPIAPPRLTLLAADGEAIARNGAIVDRPVKAGTLPLYVKQAFLAIEDRRFYTHWGVDPRGFARAAWSNLSGSGMTQGGSTITQQFAKFTFLTPERSLTRKAREMLIAFWLEAWLTKDEILERYLSNVYFGDNVYGLRAASLHYFYRQPERLTLPQAMMLAGLVQAPSRLAPTRNLKGANARAQMVENAMVAAGFMTKATAQETPLATLDVRTGSTIPTGTYFADWAMPRARVLVSESYGEERVKTTLETRLQRAARTAVGRAGLGGAQVALVAMHPNGEVVAMIGGTSYSASPFNRASQARRQPGSTFKLFVYLAALRAGMSPETEIENSPITTGAYRPKNAGDAYSRPITLKEAFARSSNVAAVRLFQKVGAPQVVAAARDLGVKSPLTPDPSLALGTSSVTLLELTAAYASVAANSWPVLPRALPEDKPGFFGQILAPEHQFDSNTHAALLEMLSAAVNQGTGRNAALRIHTYGKTGTSQDSRDALFVGFADNLVVGVWVGKDDNTPLKNVNGGGLPAKIWRDFMGLAIKGAAPVPPAPKPKPAPPPDAVIKPEDIEFPIGIDDADVNLGDNPGITLKGKIGDIDVGLDISGKGIDVKTTPAKP
jgi:penicillin-binding protein 1A